MKTLSEAGWLDKLKQAGSGLLSMLTGSSGAEMVNKALASAMKEYLAALAIKTMLDAEEEAHQSGGELEALGKKYTDKEREAMLNPDFKKDVEMSPEEWAKAEADVKLRNARAGTGKRKIPSSVDASGTRSIAGRPQSTPVKKHKDPEIRDMSKHGIARRKAEELAAATPIMKKKTKGHVGRGG